ncbi:Sterile alpha motif domain-containing protein [Perilla frutescens var. hirtella]|uniref:Sterile alpha motif domain-containing protein n=1 Tax=Perilla frutescens var. hirtella TaxID=608512 RepID=A0AAD4NXK5_PERFH|nr:Sterile alpha motif domain-containing protein [Perilla frutescens var. hirtella]
MSEASRSRVTITLGRSGQVVKRAGSSLGSSFSNEHPSVGSKRPVRERLGSNVDSSAEVNNKRLRRDGRPANAFNDIHLRKDDLRYKIMHKNILKQSQNSQQNGGDLRNILSRPAQSSTTSVTTRDRMPEPKDSRLRYLEPTDGRQHFTDTVDGRNLTPVPRSASGHIPEFRVGHAPDPRKQQILEVGDGGRSIFEAHNVRRPMPEPRPSNSMTRMDSGINPYSPWTLDRLRRRSPDESLTTSRVLTTPKKDEILQRRYAVSAYDDARTSAYMSKDAFDISRPMSSSLLTKMAPPVGQMKTMAPVASSIPMSGSLMQKSSYLVDDQVTVDSLLRSLGLEKFAVTFKAEEVDMYSLKRMTERDLKEMGIPMGPRKKILLALQPRLKQPV